MNKILVCWLTLCGGWSLHAGIALPAPVAETAKQHNARMEWWREARFGMFIHWGLYSVAAGEWNGKPTPHAGEWIQYNLQIPTSQYRTLLSQFNPERFDARRWAHLAREAGMKYIVITSKHHDGFDLFPAKFTDWSVKSTPFHRDPLRELSKACRAEGIRFCVYYSIMDWHHPDWGQREKWTDLATGTPDMDRYTDYMKEQLKELIQNYHPGVLWFDGEWESPWTHARGVDLYNYLRKLDPKLIINNRIDKGRAGLMGMTREPGDAGDFGTPEQTIPVNGFGPGVDWETCMTMNDTWGWKKSDNDWKSAPTLVRNLIDIASKGGNYLLNVGPTPEGLIPDPSVERLEAIGNWMKVNGESIYDTTASPFPAALKWGRCTCKVSRHNTTLYLHVFDWPANGRLLVPGLKNEVKSASLLAGAKGNSLPVETNPYGLVISLPTVAPDPISSTVILRLKGPVEIETASVPPQ